MTILMNTSLALVNLPPAIYGFTGLAFTLSPTLNQGLYDTESLDMLSFLSVAFLHLNFFFFKCYLLRIVVPALQNIPPTQSLKKSSFNMLSQHSEMSL